MVTRIINNSQRLGASLLPSPGTISLNSGTDRIVALHFQPDWQRALGQYVEIRRAGKTIRTGVVEAVMPDNSILWIAAAGVLPREMVMKSDGSQVFARYPWDPPPPPM
jgi:hypothetical protein